LTGHTTRVTAVAASPLADTAASADESGVVLFHDIRAPKPTATLRTPARATVAFDEQGIVVAVAADAAHVKIFSAKAPGGDAQFPAPVVELALGPAFGGAVRPDALAFEPAGRWLAAAGGGALAVLDAFRSQPPLAVARPGPPPPGCPPLRPAFSPDGEYVASGCDDCAVRAWRVRDGGAPPPAAEWAGHADAPSALAWAPGRHLVAAGCHALALWAPGGGGV
jgi:COMPASS component SWD2